MDERMEVRGQLKPFQSHGPEMEEFKLPPLLVILPLPRGQYSVYSSKPYIKPLVLVHTQNRQDLRGLEKTEPAGCVCTSVYLHTCVHINMQEYVCILTACVHESATNSCGKMELEDQCRVSIVEQWIALPLQLSASCIDMPVQVPGFLCPIQLLSNTPGIQQMMAKAFKYLSSSLETRMEPWLLTLA